MLYVDGGTIRMTRGDTVRLTVSIKNDLSGSDYTVVEGDQLTMTVKKSTNDQTFVMQKTVHGSNKFLIEPADTGGLSFGKYKYDVQLTTANGDVYTIIEPSTFELMPEVTY